MGELKKWKEEDQKMPLDLPKMTDKENQLNYAVLSKCYRTSTMLEKDISTSINNCAFLHTVV
jgi:hypothetical protein